MKNSLTAQSIKSIRCECGGSNIGETGRPLAARLREPKHNFKESLLMMSKLAQYDYAETHRVGWDVARIHKIESNSSCTHASSYTLLHIFVLPRID
jgi:hypothetical protein